MVQFSCSQTEYVVIDILPGMTVCTSVPRYSEATARRWAFELYSTRLVSPTF